MDFSRLDPCSLKRYQRYYAEELDVSPSSSKGELVAAIGRHFTRQARPLTLAACEAESAQRPYTWSVSAHALLVPICFQDAGGRRARCDRRLLFGGTCACCGAGRAAGFTAAKQTSLCMIGRARQAYMHWVVRYAFWACTRAGLAWRWQSLWHSHIILTSLTFCELLWRPHRSQCASSASPWLHWVPGAWPRI